jgi:rhodanese-related sulfurtransferase
MSLLSKVFGASKPAEVTWLDVDDLALLVAAQRPMSIIDVRGPDEFYGPLGHIESARNIPLDRIPDHAAALLSEPGQLIFVCHTDRRSAAAADYLNRGGATSVAVLRGGMVAWRSRPANS